MKYFLSAALLLISTWCLSQQLLQLQPELGSVPDLSPAAEKSIARRNQLMGQSKRTPQEEKELDNLLSIYDETVEDIWATMGAGCNWYCGGGPRNIKASSTLAPQGSQVYGVDNIHDFSLKTAWIEGVKGYGHGESVVYTFDQKSPRITTIIIYNGYTKTEKAWTENSRVKLLKLSMNGQDYAMLNLQNTRAEQLFTLPAPIGRRADGQDLTLTFTIVDTYAGTRFDDTGITEIYFDGLDVHCLARGTKITVPHGHDRNIEDIHVGDTVLTYDETRQLFYPDVVEEVAQASHHNVVTYTFDDGSQITATADHPFLLQDKGWASLTPEQSAQYKGFEHIRTIQEGDIFIYRLHAGATASRKLNRIERLAGHHDTYTITRLRSGHNFIANGYLVAIEDLVPAP